MPDGRGPLRAVRTDDPGAPNSSGSWPGGLITGEVLNVAGGAYMRN